MITTNNSRRAEMVIALGGASQAIENAMKLLAPHRDLRHCAEARELAGLRKKLTARAVEMVGEPVQPKPKVKKGKGAKPEPKPEAESPSEKSSKQQSALQKLLEDSEVSGVLESIKAESPAGVTFSRIQNDVPIPVSSIAEIVDKLAEHKLVTREGNTAFAVQKPRA